MTPLAVRAKRGSGSMRLLGVDRDELDAGLRDDQIERSHAIRTKSGLEDHRCLDKRND